MKDSVPALVLTALVLMASLQDVSAQTEAPIPMSYYKYIYQMSTGPTLEREDAANVYYRLSVVRRHGHRSITMETMKYDDGGVVIDDEYEIPPYTLLVDWEMTNAMRSLQIQDWVSPTQVKLTTRDTCRLITLAASKDELQAEGCASSSSE